MTPSFTWSKGLAFTWSKRLAGVLAVTCLLAGQAAGAEDKVLNVYNWVDYIGETTIADFEKETGIKVVYDTYDASETVDAKLLAGEAGRCPGVLQCPYHGWTYDLDGSLKAVAQERSFARLDKAALGLQPIEHEVFEGFVFIRFRGDGPSVSERFAPYAAELAHHRLGEMVPVEGLWLEETGVDWKNVWDNYLEGYHFATGHPGLSDLMGHGYDYDTGPGQVARLSHSFRGKPSKTWSARHYRKLLPDCTHLPEALRQTWSYFFLFPAMAFDIYPDKMDVFQILPTGPGQCTLRGRSYALPDERREMRAARYLNLRLNIAVQNEDNELTRSVQQGLASSSYSAGVVSEIETVLHGFQNWVRAALPVATLGAAPAPGSVAARNRALANSPQD